MMAAFQASQSNVSFMLSYKEIKKIKVYVCYKIARISVSKVRYNRRASSTLVGMERLFSLMIRCIKSANSSRQSKGTLSLQKKSLLRV